MKNYIGAKIIKAELSNLTEYKKLKYGDKALINQDDEKIEGYIVLYPPIGADEAVPYISWSPKSVFETAYREIKDCEISLCVEDSHY